jgi:hypothetical protein
MPRVNIFIRNANLEKWNKIPDKSNWVNTLLANSDNTSEYGKTRKTPAGKMTAVLGEDLPVFVNDAQFCKHNAVKGFCKKGCK